MKNKLRSLLLYLLCIGLGVIGGAWLCNLYDADQRNRSLIQAQLDMSRGNFERASATIMRQLMSDYTSGHVLDTLAWSYFCRERKSEAAYLWRVQADYFSKIDHPWAPLLNAKASAIIDQNDAVVSDSVEEIFSCEGAGKSETRD